nr:MAG TPA: hypothetical protein [Caudoviricetes sp.]
MSTLYVVFIAFCCFKDFSIDYSLLAIYNQIMKAR